MIVQITPIAIDNIGWRTYIIFAVLNALWVPIIYIFFPETKGLQLEAVDRLFAGEALLAEDKTSDETMAEEAKSPELDA
jgi:Sugar (and other) transporter